jgi:hypothetical protein
MIAISSDRSSILSDIQKDLESWTTENASLTRWFFHADEIQEKVQTHRGAITQSIEQFKVSHLVKVSCFSNELMIGRLLDAFRFEAGADG